MNANSLPSSKKNSTHLARTAPVVLSLVVVFALVVLATPAARAQTFQVIHTFLDKGDGNSPFAGLMIDAAGTFYGTTRDGGITGISGTVFKLKNYGSGWILTTLYSFEGGAGLPLDGAWPWGRVALAPDGTLYGTTSSVGGRAEPLFT
jgi:hypothetical protein